MQKEGAVAGVSMGTALAMILSFQLNHSILWAIVHGVCSWFYVIFRAIKGKLLTVQTRRQSGTPAGRPVMVLFRRHATSHTTSHC
jgi:hypothetical protein